MKPIGSYRLASVNGRDLPAEWRRVDTPNRHLIRSIWTGGRLVLDAGGRYRLSMRGVLQVGDRTDPLDVLDAQGTWRTPGPGDLELRSALGGTSRWQASTDGTVLVGRAVHRPSVGPGTRTVFVFLRD